MERRWIYERSQWPIKVAEDAWTRELNHTSWAMRDAVKDCEIVHVQSFQGLAFSRFLNRKMMLTLHGPHDENLSEYYAHYPEVHYVSISEDQRKQESMSKMRTIHHGIDFGLYRFVPQKQRYLSFIGRIAPVKGTHLAIDVAKRTEFP